MDRPPAVLPSPACRPTRAPSDRRARGSLAGAPGLAALLLVAVLALLVAPLGSLRAQSRSLAIERFHSAVDVHADGSIDVEEEIRFEFSGSWNGIYRMIPVEYRTPQGFNYHLALNVHDVVGEDGSTLRYEQDRQRHYLRLKVWVPGAVDTVQTVRIRYSVANGLRFFEEHDELYWNVTGDEWEVPIRRATARITLPEGAGGLRATAFTGGYGSRDQAATVNQTEQGFYFQTTTRLGFKEGLTAVVGWNPGVVDRPTTVEKAGFFLRSNWFFLFPILSLILTWGIWHRLGRDPALGTLVPQYEPPGGMRPGELGTLIDLRPDMRDITATIVDLAVRGYLRIEEIEEEELFGLLSDTSYSFVRTRDASEWEELEAYEKEVLKALFLTTGSRKEVRLEDLENEFYKDLPDIKNEMFDKLVDRGFYRGRPDKVRAAWMVVGVAFAFPCVIGLVIAADQMALPALPAGLAGVLTALPVIFFGYHMPIRTREGSRALTLVKGFEEFLERVEEDRFKRTIDTPEKFEAYLPYAMALKLDRKWARAFEEIFTEPPEWYVGSSPGSFRTTTFVGRLNTMSAAAGTAMASAPRSSGGSGFSGGGGGGFSGGGFGGGGGGGF